MHSDPSTSHLNDTSDVISSAFFDGEYSLVSFYFDRPNHGLGIYLGICLSAMVYLVVIFATLWYGECSKNERFVPDHSAPHRLHAASFIGIDLQSQLLQIKNDWITDLQARLTDVNNSLEEAYQDNRHLTNELSKAEQIIADLRDASLKSNTDLLSRDDLEQAGEIATAENDHEENLEATEEAFEKQLVEKDKEADQKVADIKASLKGQLRVERNELISLLMQPDQTIDSLRRHYHSAPSTMDGSAQNLTNDTAGPSSVIGEDSREHDAHQADVTGSGDDDSALSGNEAQPRKSMKKKRRRRKRKSTKPEEQHDAAEEGEIIDCSSDGTPPKGIPRPKLNTPAPADSRFHDIAGDKSPAGVVGSGDTTQSANDSAVAINSRKHGLTSGNSTVNEAATGSTDSAAPIPNNGPTTSHSYSQGSNSNNLHSNFAPTSGPPTNLPAANNRPANIVNSNMQGLNTPRPSPQSANRPNIDIFSIRPPSQNPGFRGNFRGRGSFRGNGDFGVVRDNLGGNGHFTGAARGNFAGNGNFRGGLGQGQFFRGNGEFRGGIGRGGFFQ